MEHSDQHIEAINKSVKFTRKTTTQIFDDKIKSFAFLEVENGRIVIKLDYVPMFSSNEATAKFLAEAISLAIEQCYLKNDAPFDPFT